MARHDLLTISETPGFCRWLKEKGFVIDLRTHHPILFIARNPKTKVFVKAYYNSHYPSAASIENKDEEIVREYLREMNSAPSVVPQSGL